MSSTMQNSIKKVGLFVPCCVDQYWPDVAWKTLHLLQSLGLECHYPAEVSCCGRELFMQGDREGAKRLGEKMMELYDDCSHVVSCDSGCVAYIKRHFGKLFHNTILHNSFRQFCDKCFDLSDFLVNIMHYSPSVRFPHTVTVADHCATQHDYLCLAHPNDNGLHDEVRKLLNAVEGLHVVEMAQNDVCCGMGGMFASDFSSIANDLAKRKIDNAVAAGAEYIVTTESSCRIHMQSSIDKNKSGLKCIHLVDILCYEE